MKPLINIVFAGIILITSSCNNDVPDAFAYGNFESEDIMISSEMTGQILILPVNEGDRIEKGDIITVIDTVQLLLKRNQLLVSKKAVTSKLALIDAQIGVNEVSLTNMERELKRFGNLFLEQAATKKQIDDLQGQINLVRAQVDVLNVQKKPVYIELESINTQVEQIDDQISKCYVRAPVSGTILERYCRQGELAVTGKRLVKITDLSELNLRVFIDGKQLSEVKMGEQVNVVYDGPEGLKTVSGTITWISPEAEFTPKIIQTREDRISLVYAMKVRVKNNGEMKIGMPGEINLVTDAGS